MVGVEIYRNLLVRFVISYQRVNRFHIDSESVKSIEKSN